MKPSGVIEADEIHREIRRMVEAVAANISDPSNLRIVGIANGGIALAKRVAEMLANHFDQPVDWGVVDITFHRDDISLRPITKISLPTELEFPLDHATVLLVDDVLHSGRTARAAINELFDQGRPENIELLVLANRPERRLPIQPDYFGHFDALNESTSICVTLDNAQPQHDRITYQTNCGT